MQNLAIRLCLLSCFQLVFCINATADSLNQVTADYEVFFNQMISDRNYPGAAYAIVSRESILKIGTAGNTTANGQHPIDPQTVFRLASVSKPFAAVLVGLLVEEGSLNWDDPISRYVPAFKIDGDVTRIRIRHILGQSTGLMPHAYDNLLEDGKSMDSIAENIAFITKSLQCLGYFHKNFIR